MKTKNNINLKGLALASLVIPIGIVLWVVLWNMGFMASLVAFVIAYGAVWLYKTQTNGEITKPAAVALLGLIVLGVFLSFVSGMIADGWSAYSSEISNPALLSADFWQFIVGNLSDGAIWQAYSSDLIIAIVFALIGSGYELYRLFVPEKKPAADKTDK